MPRWCRCSRGHPGSGTFFVREDLLVDRLSDFLSEHVFGAYQHHLLDAGMRHLDDSARREHEQQVAALRRAIAETDTRIKRTVRNLKLVDNPDHEFIRDINERRAELRSHREQLEAQLATAEERVRTAPNPALIDALPVGRVQLDRLPEPLARGLFEALRLEIHYDKTTNQATCRITLSGDTVNAARRTATTATEASTHAATGPAASGTGSIPILVVPPAGLEPAA